MICGNRDIIESILNDPEVESTFFVDGKNPGYVSGDNVLYLYCDGCLFPSVIKSNDCLSVHAAIPKGARGKVAVNSGKKAIKWLQENLNFGKIIARIDATRPNVNVYAKLCGMVKYGSDDKYNYYVVP